MNRSSPDIFVSHAHDNRVVVESLAEFLRESMVVQASRIRITSAAGHKLGFGADFSVLREEIKECKAFLLFLTPQAQGKPNVMMELGAAWAFEKPIFALLTRGVPFSALGFESMRHSLNMDEPEFNGDLKEWLRALALSAGVQVQDELVRDRARDRFVRALEEVSPALTHPTPRSPRSLLRKRVLAWANVMREGQRVPKPSPVVRPDQIRGYMDLASEALDLDPAIKVQKFSTDLGSGHFSILGYTDVSVESIIAAAEMLAINLDES